MRWGQPLTGSEWRIVKRILIGLFYLAAGYLYVLNFTLSYLRSR